MTEILLLLQENFFHVSHSYLRFKFQPGGMLQRVDEKIIEKISEALKR